MRVVLFCGGPGMRLRANSDPIAKPMVPIGYRPLIWWVMKYYAHFGHHDFILCLGYKGDSIKDYFLSYNECLSNDFVLSRGGQSIELLQTDIEAWRITFVDSGINASIGERLLAVAPLLRNEDVFLANYSDSLTDCPLPARTAPFMTSGLIASFLSVRPNFSSHFVTHREDGVVTGVNDVLAADVWMNGGSFVLRREVLSYIHPGEDLVAEPFQRLVEQRKLGTDAHEGFWRSVDTFKDLQVLENLYAKGHPPWEVWGRKKLRGSGGATGRDPAI